MKHEIDTNALDGDDGRYSVQMQFEFTVRDVYCGSRWFKGFLHFYRCKENTELFDKFIEVGRQAAILLAAQYPATQYLEVEIAPLQIVLKLDTQRYRKRLQAGLWDLQVTANLSIQGKLEFSAVSTHFIREEVYAQKISKCLFKYTPLPGDLHKIITDYLLHIDHDENEWLKNECTYLYFPLDGKEHFFSQCRMAPYLLIN